MNKLPEWIDEDAVQNLSEDQKTELPSLVNDISQEGLIGVCSSKIQKILSFGIITDEYIEEFKNYTN